MILQPLQSRSSSMSLFKAVSTAKVTGRRNKSGVVTRAETKLILLLSYKHYDAILACNEVDDPEHRHRNLSLLVQEASWYSKPLLRVVALLFRCIQPEHTAQNSLNIIAVAVLSTPCMFRPYLAALHTYFHDIIFL